MDGVELQSDRTYTLMLAEAHGMNVGQ